MIISFYVSFIGKSHYIYNLPADDFLWKTAPVLFSCSELIIEILAIFVNEAFLYSLGSSRLGGMVPALFYQIFIVAIYLEAVDVLLCGLVLKRILLRKTEFLTKAFS